MINLSKKKPKKIRVNKKKLKKRKRRGKKSLKQDVNNNKKRKIKEHKKWKKTFKNITKVLIVPPPNSSSYSKFISRITRSHSSILKRRTPCLRTIRNSSSRWRRIRGSLLRFYKKF